MEAGINYIRNRIPASLVKLWKTRDELSFAQIRVSHFPYMLPLCIILTLLDQRNTYFTPSGTFLGSDTSTIVYAAYTLGTLFVLFFCMKKLIGGLRILSSIAVAGFALWLLLPEGDTKTVAMLVFQFAIGGCAVYATYAHVFVLNNAERLFSIFIVTLNYGIFVFLEQNGINNLFLSAIVPGVLVLIFAVCTFLFKLNTFPDNSPEVAITPPRSIYIVLVCPFAFFTLNVFGEAIINTGTGAADMRGVGAVIAAFLAVIVQFGLRRSVWHMLNLFLIFTMTGIMLAALPLSFEMRSIGNLLFGIGDGFGYIMTFYIVGFIKKYRNDKFFWRITLATMGELLFAIVATDIVSRFFPGAMPAVAIGFSFLFLFVFQFISPVLQRNVFASDWIDEFLKPDMSLVMKKVKQTDEFEGLKLSPREKEVATFLLQGMTFRQISGVLGISESTVNGYSGTLYKKLGINSRAELFIRFGVTNGNGDKSKQPPTLKK